jgi:hypothetical protein
MTDGGEQRSTSDTAASPAWPRSNWPASRVIGMVFASIGGLIALALLVGGVAVMASYAFGRDDDGYFNSDRHRLESAAYAVTMEDIDLGADELDWGPGRDPRRHPTPGRRRPACVRRHRARQRRRSLPR